MKKITVIGVYGIGPEFTTGQAVKSIELINWLIKQYSSNNVNIVNTHGWKKNPINLLIGIIKSFLISDNIVMLPAQNGLKVIAPLVYIMNLMFKRSIHYVVVGGWLPKTLINDRKMKKIVQTFDGVYVELESMIIQLKKIGVSNVFYLPNVRNVQSGDDLSKNNKKENVCVYSRITETKGISDAIEIVRAYNSMQDVKEIKLDFYGKVANDYTDDFDKLMRANSDIVEYKGVKNADEGVKIVSNYKALLFPTYYEGEGFAGTILDAFGSGTPVIANDWKYNSEIIESGINGFIYPYRNIGKAADLLNYLLNNEKKYQEISLSAKKKSFYFLPDNVYPKLIKKFRGL